MNEGIPLEGRHVSNDPAMQKVIDAQSKLKEANRKVKALEADREQLLDEYNDVLRARDVPKSPSSLSKTKTDFVRVSFGDMHGMRMDRKAVEAMLRDIKTLAPDEVVIGGDMVECGGWLAKHQPIGYVASVDYSYQEDIAAASWFLDELQKAAPNAVIHYLIGNHEDRIERWCVDQTMAHQRDAEFLRQAFAPSSLLRLKERGIQYYERSKVYVDGLPRGWVKLGKMYFTHELSGGKQASGRAADRTAGNVRFFHTHQQGQSTRVFPAVGLVKAFAVGCLCDMQPIWKHSDPSNWSQSYDIDFVAKSGIFQVVSVPIWRGESLATAMIERFKA